MPLAIAASFDSIQDRAARILRLDAAAAGGHARRFRRPRPAPLLRLLRIDAGADVLHHRHLGRARAPLRRRQILPVHLRRLGLHARRRSIYLGSRPARSIIDTIGSHIAQTQPAPIPSAGGCFWGCSPASPSRCRCSRCTPGCPWRTPKRRRPARVILAGVLLKLGTYGLLRLAVPIGLLPPTASPFPQLIHFLGVICVIGIIYARAGRLGAAGHQEARRLQLRLAPGVLRPGHSPSTTSASRLGPLHDQPRPQHRARCSS